MVEVCVWGREGVPVVSYICDNLTVKKQNMLLNKGRGKTTIS